MFIALVESEEANIATEHDTLGDAIKVANNIITNQDYGKIFAVQIFETDEIVMGTKNIKEQCKLVASLRVLR